jgi:inorganic pyrophosphatase
MNFIHDIPTFAEPGIINVIVEIPKGTTAKYEVSNSGDFITIATLLHNKYRYPFNYGSIPQTLSNDGDMLDAIVLCDEPILPGTIIQCQIVAMVKTTDNGQEDNKIICVPKCNDKKISKFAIKKIRWYLKHYNYHEQKAIQVLETATEQDAINEIQNCVKRYLTKYSTVTKTKSTTNISII